jgi:hypothetical protein
MAYERLEDKDPDSVVDYMASWATWLGADTISTTSWLVNGVAIAAGETVAGLTLDSKSDTTTTATAWLSGGIVGSLYRLTSRIVTAGGRTEDKTVEILCVQK